MINELAKKIHENAVLKGFWINDNFAQKIMMVVTELSESVEAHRNNDYRLLDEKLYNLLKEQYQENDYLFNVTFVNKVKDGVADELTDVLIRTMDLMVYLGIDIEKHIELKMMYNAGRPYLHNKEY